MPMVIQNFAYDANNNTEYVGVAIQGSLDSDLQWRIEKLTWESDGVGGFRCISSRFSRSKVSWNGRSEHVYS